MGGLQAVSSFGALDSGNEEIVQLTLIMMPSLFFICLYGINSSLLQCEKNYFYSSAAPIAFNLIWIVGVMCSSHLPMEEAVVRLSFFVILASFGQWAVTLPKTLSSLKNLEVKGFFKGTKLFSKDVLRLCIPLVLGVIGVAASQINNAMDAVFARWADDEGPAFLWYAIRLQQLPLALFGVALSSALLPPLSRAIKAKDKEQSEKFLNFSSLRTIQAMLPITFCLLIMGDGCINLVYGHGDFTANSIAGTTLCLWGYTLGLIPMALVLSLAPAYYASGDYKTPSKASVGSMAVNLSLNAMLVGVFDAGAASVAVATSISAWINVFWLGYFFHKLQIKESWFSKSLWIQTGQILAASLFTSIMTLCIDQMLWSNHPALSILFGSNLYYEMAKGSQILRLATLGLPFLVLFYYILRPLLRLKTASP